jgi:putative FmdB family regulatory protein
MGALRMPIYEYACKACHHEFEALQKMQDAPLTVCPACHQPSLGKKVSAAGFRLTGGGWYETDFKSGSKKNLAGEGAKPADTPSNAPKETAKPAPKTDTQAAASTSTSSSHSSSRK